MVSDWRSEEPPRIKTSPLLLLLLSLRRRRHRRDHSPGEELEAYADAPLLDDWEVIRGEPAQQLQLVLALSSALELAGFVHAPAPVVPEPEPVPVLVLELDLELVWLVELVHDVPAA